MSDLEDFRRETRAWLQATVPASLRGRVVTQIEGTWGGRRAVYESPDEKRWLDAAAERGLTAPTWPREYGGGGLSKEEAKVLREEMKALGVPAPLVGFGLEMIGPVLLRFGNEEQKREHIPPIVRGEIRWCQGYSEPGAGSDLASLQMRAERDGDDFILNGQKVWTSYADVSDWIFCLVRTDPTAPKHDGISFILVDMETPGVSVKPIQLISGKSPFCETFFEDVRVPVRNVVHDINAGWTVAKALLGHERSMIAGVFGTSAAGPSKGHRSRLAEHAIRYLGTQEGRLAEGPARDRVAQSEMDTRALALTVQRSTDGARAGHEPGPESSLFKIYGTELNQRRMELMVSLAGPAALGWEGPGFDDEELALTRDWLRSRGNTIEGGTSEIQLNIIAKRVLGLPD